MKKNDKRGAPRVPYISEVVCEGGGISLTARTIDLSASGVFIHSKLCCAAGLVLKLRFTVASTEIETIGEVCYSMPQIGMGVRFLDLKREYRAAIEKLIESQRAHAEDEKVIASGRRIIPSGVEPVDRLLGGLDGGHMYLTHGDASGKSLFGLEFLIAGLKNVQTSALIAPYSTESVVKRFGRLGYDCREDLCCGRLVTFKYPNNIAEQVHQLGHLAPLLRELEPILDESAPKRIVFDPVNELLAGEGLDEIAGRVSEFAVWIRSFGATVVLVANGDNGEVIESLRPSVKESFRFEVRESSDRVVRYLAFEKSPSIPDQSVRVDPSRGIFLLEEQQSAEQPNEGLVAGSGTSSGVDEDRGRVEEEQPVDNVHTRDRESFEPAFPMATQNAARSEEQQDAFFAMLDELQSFASSLDPDVSETDKNQPSALGG